MIEKMKIPAEVKIGPYLIPIKEVGHIDNGEGAYLWGLTKSEDKEILLLRDVREDVKLETFWHEVVHALDHVWGALDLVDERYRENIVRRLGISIYQFLVDNPGIFNSKKSGKKGVYRRKKAGGKS